MMGEEKNKPLRQKMADMVISHLTETKDETWCKCDICTLIRLKAIDETIINSLALVGFQYLLGENFNDAAALHYFSYFSDLQNLSK